MNKDDIFKTFGGGTYKEYSGKVDGNLHKSKMMFTEIIHGKKVTRVVIKTTYPDGKTETSTNYETDESIYERGKLNMPSMY